jgi:hypothetical protein
MAGVKKRCCRRKWGKKSDKKPQVVKLKKGPQVKLVKQKGCGAGRVPKSNKGQVKACVIIHYLG